MQITDSERLRFSRFEEADTPALARLLGDSSLTRNITTSASSEGQAMASARKRITWHNSCWTDRGYGVWALRASYPGLAPPDRLLGWCGFIPADGDDPDPEILYAIDAEFRGKGLASEAARHCINWLFDSTDYQGVTAVISTRLNPGSVNVVSKLGLVFRGRMDFELFLSSRDLADEVVGYEIWRLAQDTTTEPGALVEQSAYRAGQLSRVSSMASADILALLGESLAQRFNDPSTRSTLQQGLQEEFFKGRDEAFMDCYHVPRRRWLELARP